MKGWDPGLESQRDHGELLEVCPITLNNVIPESMSESAYPKVVSTKSESLEIIEIKPKN